MDPYKILGISASKVKHPSDLDKVRHRAKQLFKRHSKEGKKFDAKKILEAFQLVEQNLKGKPGEGQYQIRGKSQKERELDKHFNHQTKEIKKDKGLKRKLAKARHGTGKERIHLPGDKERIPRPRRKHRHHKRRRRRTEAEVNILEGLNRLAVFLPQEAKFPKVIKLLHRWMKDYLSADNREHIFKVLQGVAECTFLLDDPDTRQDVVMVFEYVLGYFSQWFEQGEDDVNFFGKSWQIGTVLACRCFTDDAFVLTSALGQLNGILELLEKHKDQIGVPKEKAPRLKKEKCEGGVEKKEEKKEEDGLRAKEEDDDESDGVKSEGGASSDGEFVRCVNAAREVKGEVKTEAAGNAGSNALAAPVALLPQEQGPQQSASSGRQGTQTSSATFGPLASPVSDDAALPAALQGCPSPFPSPFPSSSPMASPSSELGDGLEVLSSDGDCVDVDSEEEVQSVESDDGMDVKEEIDIDGDGSEVGVDGVSSEGEVEEVEGSIFPIPPMGASLEAIRMFFVDRCLATLFKQRGALWARPKIDTFFQDVFYRRAVFTLDQQGKVEAWQSRIKSNQRLGVRQVGETNNPMEAQRPVIDSREVRNVMDADSNTWAAKQTFDSRESSAQRVIR